MEKAAGLDRVKVTEEEWIYSNENLNTLGQVWVWCGDIKGEEDEIGRNFLRKKITGRRDNDGSESGVQEWARRPTLMVCPWALPLHPHQAFSKLRVEQFFKMLLFTRCVRNILLFRHAWYLRRVQSCLY